MKKISIVIPVYNEEHFISGLLKSINRVAYPPDDYETIVVSDGCTDGTVSAVKKFPAVRLIELAENEGRYAARKAGAQAAAHPNILFIDSRSVVDPSILAVLNKSSERVIVGTVLGIEKPGAFETFYASIRRKMFPAYYADPSRIIELNRANFESLPKGTTVFFVEKAVLFRAYEDLSDTDMGKRSSDDTKLIRTIVDRTPAIIHPGVRITSFYRRSFWKSILHLALYRGSTFVDYYFDPAKRNFWLVIILPLSVLMAMLIGAITFPASVLSKLAVLLVLDVVITLVLARTLREFYVILFMLPLCVAVFYMGVIRGIVVKYFKAFRTR